MEDSPSAAIRHLYERILLAWNQRDAGAMAACFEEDGSMVGFDGSQVDTREQIESHLGPIFADHPTAAYVAKVREVRSLGPGVGLLRAVAGMLPPGSEEIKADRNTIHSLVAVKSGDGWRAALFQSTPAAWHGRPEDSAALTEELQSLVQDRSDHFR
jgi:uncharacterized protein (TIGR02246 family)